jgi:hypothetical protein
MLRVSGEHLGQEPDLGALTDARVDPVTPDARELLAVADAVVLRDPDELPIAVERLVVALGPEAAVRAVAVAANFQMMNRMLDAIGVDYGGSPELAATIGVPFPVRG